MGRSIGTPLLLLFYTGTDYLSLICGSRNRRNAHRSRWSRLICPSTTAGAHWDGADHPVRHPIPVEGDPPAASANFCLQHRRLQSASSICASKKPVRNSARPFSFIIHFFFFPPGYCSSCCWRANISPGAARRRPSKFDHDSRVSLVRFFFFFFLFKKHSDSVWLGSRDILITSAKIFYIFSFYFCPFDLKKQQLPAGRRIVIAV